MLEREMPFHVVHPPESGLLPAKLVWNPTEGKYAADQRRWQGIPGIERTAGGKIYALFYTGWVDEGPGNYVMILRSTDQGQSYQPFLAIEPPVEEARCFDAVPWIDPQGRLWIFYAQSYGFCDGRMGVWAVVSDNPDAEQPQFAPPRRIANGAMMNKPIVLRDGAWLLPCAIWKDISIEPNFDLVGNGCKLIYELPEERFSNVYRSDDSGKTFRLIGHADDPMRGPDEHMLVERSDGSIRMYVRRKSGIGIADSYDGGKSWQNERDSGLGGPGSRFCIRRLRSGRLLLLNHWQFTGRNRMTAFLSEDDGETWPYQMLIEATDVSYPDCTEDENGRLYIIYDHRRYTIREIMVSSVTEQEIMAGSLTEKESYLSRVISKATGPDPRQ